MTDLSTIFAVGPWSGQAARNAHAASLLAVSCEAHPRPVFGAGRAVRNPGGRGDRLTDSSSFQAPNSARRRELMVRSRFRRGGSDGS